VTRIIFAILPIFVIGTFGLTNLAFGAVTEFTLEESFYTNEELFTFIGKEEVGLKSVFVTIRDPTNNFVGMASDPASDADGSFSTIPRPVENFFSIVGIYTATAFTDDQNESEGIIIPLIYDGVKVSVAELPDNNGIKVFGSFGTGDGKFKNPSGLALDTGTDFLYIADTDNDRIQIVDVDGNCGSDELAERVCFVDEFGESGTNKGEFEFKSPSGLALHMDTDLLYITDTDNGKIQIVDVDGNCSGSDELADDVCFVDEFGIFGTDSGKFDTPRGLSLDDSRNFLYIADTGNNRIQIVDVDGNCNSSDEEFLADDICFVDEFGGSGNGQGEFDVPSYLSLHTSNDLLFIADTDNNQIQIIDVDGNCSGSTELANDICFVDSSLLLG
jgi:sugar lactone lactonase YvrE